MSSLEIPDEPLRIGRPKFIPTKGLTKQGLYNIGRGNACMQEVFDETQESYPAPFARMPRIATEVRWSLLQKTRRAMAQTMGMKEGHYTEYEQMRGEGQKLPTRNTTSRLLAAWRELGIPLAIREQYLDCIEEHVTENEGPVMGFYARLGHDVGEEAFEEGTGLTVKTLHKRRTGELSAPYSEAYEAIDALYPGRSAEMRRIRELRHQHAHEIWITLEQQLLQERDFPPVSQKLLAALECHAVEEYGEPLGYKLLGRRSAYGLPYSTVNQLMTGKVAPYADAVRSVVDRVLQPDDAQRVGAEWERLHAEAAHEETFTQMLNRLRRENDVNLREVTYCLSLQTHPYVIAARRRRKSCRWSSFYGQMTTLMQPYCFRIVPPRTVCALATDDAQERRELQSLFMDQRRQHLTARQQAVPEGAPLDLTLACEWHGVSDEEVCAWIVEHSGVHMDAGWLRHFADCKAGRIDAPPREYAYLMEAVRSVGSAKVKQALARRRRGREVPRHCQKASTVPEGIALLSEGSRGYGHLAAKIREESDVTIDGSRLKRFVDGTAPVSISLPELREIYRSCSTALPVAVEKDWYLQYASCLSSKSKGNRHPLVRLLLVLMHSQEVHMEAFCEEKNVPFAEVEFFLHKLRHGGPLNFAVVENILRGAEVGAGERIERLAKLLFDGATAEDALRQLCGDDYAQKDLDPRQFPGFTREELHGE